MKQNAFLAARKSALTQLCPLVSCLRGLLKVSGDCCHSYALLCMQAEAVRMAIAQVYKIVPKPWS